MSVFKRVRDITMSNLNALLDKAEDPVKMLEQYLIDMEEEITNAETGVVKQIALVKKLEKQLNEARELAAKREEQAMQALEKGKEDLARRALEDKRNHQQKVDDLQGQCDSAHKIADSLRHQLSEMKTEYENLKAKKETLQARAEAAKAQKTINQAFRGFGNNSVRDGFDKMEDKVMELESQAEASFELRDNSSDLDKELESLGASDVDDELARLKEKLAKKN